MHKAPCTIYSGMSHTFQQEMAWRTVAIDIQHWLRSVLTMRSHVVHHN